MTMLMPSLSTRLLPRLLPRLLLLAVAAPLALVAAGAPAVGAATRGVVITASYRGSADFAFASDEVVLHGRGTGTGGLDEVTGTGVGGASACASLVRELRLSGKDGALELASGSRGVRHCLVRAESPTKFEVSGQALIAGGTGRFKGATGLLGFRALISVADVATSAVSTTFRAAFSGLADVAAAR